MGADAPLKMRSFASLRMTKVGYAHVQISFVIPNVVRNLIFII